MRGAAGGEQQGAYGSMGRPAFSEPAAMLPNQGLSAFFGGASAGPRIAGGVGAPEDDGPARSSLSMLHYAGATALGGGGGGGPMGGQGMLPMGNQQGVMPTGVPPADDPQSMQKRRFVWTADLHSRFEAAVNALGLDNAKPKSILKLMNVEGLTKANIKSHLQKYRCLMQKKAQARTNGGGMPTSSGGGGGGAMGSLLQASSAAAGAARLDGCLSANANGGGLPPLPSLEALSAGMGSASNTSSASTVNVDGLDPMGAPIGEPLRCGALPEQLLSQGESSLQRNLEVQEMTLKVQMELQEELSRQLQLQKKLQGEMETLMAAHEHVRDESTSTNSKMSSILGLKRKLQHELHAHLRMQHQLLSQLNQVVLPAVERLQTGSESDTSNGLVRVGSGGAAEAHMKFDGGGVAGVSAEWAAKMEGEDGEEDDGEDDGEDDDDDAPSPSPPKKRRAE